MGRGQVMSSIISYSNELHNKYSKGYNQAIDDMTELIKAKYIGGSDE
jgi:hypothetical protein